MKDMLKKLFIPHKANNYKPLILHPKRLLFHGAAALVVKAVVLVALLALPAGAWLTPDVLTRESKEIITMTNDLRLKMGMAALQENALLNQAAFDKAQDMMVNQYFAHMSPDNKNMIAWLKIAGYGYAAAGENLAMGFSSAKDVVAAWTKSKTHYANLIDPDFKDIGVAMVSGNFKTYDTTMVAQYFGAPKVITNSVAVAVLPQPKVSPKYPKASTVAKKEVKGIKIADNIALADLTAPAVDLNKTKIWVSQPGLQQDKIIQVEAYLSLDVVSAQVNFQNYIINLSQDSLDKSKWTGSGIIAKDTAEQIFSPVVLANLTARDQAGNESSTDINWANYQEIKPSLVKQYLFIKNSSSPDVKSLNTVSKIYFLLLLSVIIIALLLNIFIEIKKQHPHIIASSLALISLLVLLIII